MSQFDRLMMYKIISITLQTQPCNIIHSLQKDQICYCLPFTCIESLKSLVPDGLDMAHYGIPLYINCNRDIAIQKVT